MRTLVIGGSRFVGYTIIETLLAHNHTVTMFNRGVTNPDVFNGKIDKIIGDRDGDIASIGDQHFDVVIDTCGFVPRVVKQSVDFLKDKTSIYVFISAQAVYTSRKISEYSDIVVDESSTVRELADKTTEEVHGNYGGLKVLCEKIVQEKFGPNSIIIRPGLIVGPHDNTNMLTYWAVRIRQGGKVLAPGDKAFYCQIIDARDLAEFILKLVEEKKNGIFNVTGPQEPYNFQEMLSEIQKITNSTTEFVWASNEWLKQNNVEEWLELPLWYTPEQVDLYFANISKAIENGLRFRTLEQTVTDTLMWFDKDQVDPKTWRVGLASDKEKKLLDKLSIKSS